MRPMTSIDGRRMPLEEAIGEMIEKGAVPENVGDGPLYGLPREAGIAAVIRRNARHVRAMAVHSGIDDDIPW